MKPHTGPEQGQFIEFISLAANSFIAQLVEHGTGIAEVTGSNPVEALIFFFRLPLSNCLNWKTVYCDDQPSLGSTTAIQIYDFFHIYFPSNPVDIAYPVVYYKSG